MELTVDNVDGKYRLYLKKTGGDTAAVGPSIQGVVDLARNWTLIGLDVVRKPRAVLQRRASLVLNFRRAGNGRSCPGTRGLAAELDGRQWLMENARKSLGDGAVRTEPARVGL